MALRITIAGDIGSGKTTVARRLAEVAGVEPLSTGGIQRRLAQARGITVLELNRLAESDARIDKEIDSYQINLPSGNLVVESRMGWHFVPNALKVYLYVSDHEAARRLVGARRADEDYSQVANPLAQILARRRSELRRFRQFYNVNIDDLANYDVVVDTTFANVDDVVARILEPLNSGSTPVCWIDPRNLVPTQAIRDIPTEKLAAIENDIAGAGFRSAHEVVALYVDHVFFIVDGHARVAAALRRGVTFVPTVVAASNDQPHDRGLSARQYVRDAVHDSLVHDWQEAVGFHFRDEIWKGRAGIEPETAPDG